MASLFLTILNMSISAGWIVLAVVLVRILLKKAPKWITVLLWGIVAIRLIFPFTIQSRVSMQPSSQIISPQIMTEAAPQVNTGISFINNTVNPIIRESAITVAPEKTVNSLQLFVLIFSKIWIVGAILMLLYTLLSYWRIRRKVGTAILLRDNILQSEQVVSPFVLGLIKPRIYLPFSLKQADMEYVLAHEQAHIRRKDHWWKPIGFFLLAIHWFNPLLWLGYVLLCRDIELACDEKVVKDMDTQQKADYSQALLSCSVNRHMIAACPLAFGEVGVKNRVKSVLNYKKPAFWIILAAIAASIVVAVCFLTDPVTEPKPEEAPPAPQGTPITWEYLPMASFTRNNAFYFDFNFPYSRIEASCTGGKMWRPAAEGQPSEDTMTYEAGESVCWWPYEAVVENIPDLADVVLDIYHEDGTVGYCKLRFTCTERSDMGRATYQVSVVAADQYEMFGMNNGGMIYRRVPLEDVIPREPPTLVVIACNQSIAVDKEGYSWAHWQSDGTIESAGSYPTENISALPVVEIVPSYYSASDPLSTLLQFNVLGYSEVYPTSPATVTVQCWEKDQWYTSEPKSEEIPVHTDNGNWYFSLKDEECIYEVTAVWNHPQYSGLASYRFRATRPSLTRYPVIDADSKVKEYYHVTPTEQLDAAYDREDWIITQPHAQLEDGLWAWAQYGYLYRLEISGRLNNAQKNTTYIILSNTKDITFDQAWKASGLSSNLNDYFSPETAVIVGHRLYD